MTAHDDLREQVIERITVTTEHFSPEALALMEQVRMAWDCDGKVTPGALSALIALMPAPEYEPTDAEVAAFMRAETRTADGARDAARRLHAAGFRWAPDE